MKTNSCHAEGLRGPGRPRPSGWLETGFPVLFRWHDAVAGRSGRIKGAGWCAACRWVR
jgi:hypothetical protein